MPAADNLGLGGTCLGGRLGGLVGTGITLPVGVVHALAALYPCEECAAHFREVLAADPPETASREAFSGWLCRVHNVVNRSLDKPAFDCARADLRWSPLACTVGEKAACRRGGVP